MNPGPLTEKKQHTFLSPLILPLAFFLLSSIIILFIWNNARENRIRNLEHETAVTAEQIKLRLEAWIDSRTAILRHMGSFVETLPLQDDVGFRQEAKKIIGLYPGFQAINLIDEDWFIRIVVPLATNEAALNKDLHKHPTAGVGDVVQISLDTGEIHRSPLMHLLQGKPGFATYFPVHRADGSLVGIINGVFLMENVVNNCLSEKRLKERFAIRIFTLAHELAYSHEPAGFPPGFEGNNEAIDIRIVDKNWKLVLVPMAAVNQPLLVTERNLGLIGGIFLALALSVLLRAYLLRLVELRESRANYKLLVDHQADMVVKQDSEFRVVFASPTTMKKLAIPEDELLGRHTSDFVHPEDLHLVREHREEIFKGEDDSKSLVLRIKSGDEWMWTSWTGSNMRDKEGHLIARISVGRDITHERDMESRLRQGQKLQAVGQLAGGVAHDFNNIIQAILGYLGFVMADLPPDSEAYNDLTQAELAAERAATLTRQLLAFSRRQLLQPVLLDLNDVVSELLPMLRRLLGESIDLKFKQGQNIGSVKADRGQLEQILVNLCVNARDAIVEETGIITIETNLVTLDHLFCRHHQWAEPGQWVQLKMDDSGLGMDKNTLSQVFEPFFTTKETGKGTGLGLATVYGIVKQHDGLINVTSAPGQGTSFSLYLKAMTEELQSEQATTSPSVKTGEETVLLAEDEAMVRNLTTRILEMAGYRVLVAENGLLASELWAEKKEEIDLVVMDVVMPRMGGHELSQLIRKDNPDIKILFISGYDSQSFRTPLAARESEELLLKPFNQSALLERVRKILDR